MKILQSSTKEVFVALNRREAIRLIHSLSCQILENSHTAGRAEILQDDTYFSVSVDPEEEPK